MSAVQPCPAGLMRGADASARVAMEILVEPHVVTEMRVGLEFLDVAKNRASAVRIPLEYARQPTGQILLVGEFTGVESEKFGDCRAVPAPRPACEITFWDGLLSRFLSKLGERRAAVYPSPCAR